MSELERRLPVGRTLGGRREHVGVDTPRTRHLGTEWARSYRLKLTVTDSLIIALAVFAGLATGDGGRFFVTGFAGLTLGEGVTPLMIALVWFAALSAQRTRDSKVLGIGVTEYKRVVGSTAVVFGLLAIGFLMFSVVSARAYFVITFPVGLLGLLTGRWLWRQWLTRKRLEGHYLSRALVVGGREDVEYVARQIGKKAGASYDIVCVVLDQPDGEAVEVSGHSIPVVSGLDHIAQAAENTGADTVIVAGQPSAGTHFIRNLAWDLEGTATELVVASRLTNVAGPRIHIRPVEGLPLMHVELPQFEGSKYVLKRLFDVVVSGLALLVLTPLLAVVAVLVRHDSAGPVFFRQERVGRAGRRFEMVKFRSMVVGAEAELDALRAQDDGNGVLFKLKDDPRVTRVGHVLRKYSLDELPQLWNILVGDMSLVGPRPPLVSEVETYEDHVNRRLYTRPGLTGLWQVSGRSDLSWEESVRLDLYYVENWSLTGDLVLLWRTVKTVLHSDGAY